MGSNADKVKAWDGTTEVDVDSLSNSFSVIDVPHREVHEGEMFSASYLFASIADNVRAKILVKVGATKELHLIPSFAAGGNARASAYSGVTTSAIGTTITSFDMNRSTANSPTARFYHTPTVSTEGTLLFQTFMPGGTRVQASGGSTSGRHEWILAKSTDYLFEIANKSASAADVSQNFNYYEE